MTRVLAVPALAASPPATQLLAPGLENSVGSTIGPDDALSGA